MGATSTIVKSVRAEYSDLRSFLMSYFSTTQIYNPLRADRNQHTITG